MIFATRCTLFVLLSSFVVIDYIIFTDDEGSTRMSTDPRPDIAVISIECASSPRGIRESEGVSRGHHGLDDS